MKKRHLLKKTQDTRNIIHRIVQNTLQNPLLESPSAAPLYFFESHWGSEISSLSKVIVVLGKARSHRVLNLGCSGADSPGWFDVSPKISAGDTMQVHCRDEAADPQLPAAVAFWSTPVVSVEECASKKLMQIHCSTSSVIVNAMATQYTCSLSGIYRPHWRVQRSGHCSCMCIPVHSPWLPGYIDVTNHSHHVNNGWTFSGQTSYLVYILCT